MKYDIVFDACECDTYNRGTSNNYEGYANFLSYLNAGGRAITTHYFYNFFADTSQCGGGGLLGNQYCYGQSPLPTIGAWEKNTGRPMAAGSNCPKDSTLGSGSGYGYGTSGGSCMTIDTSIPKGVAFAQWYQDNNAKLMMGGGEKYGYVGLTDIRADMGALESSLVSAGTATPWLYAGDLASKYDAYYFSVNTPVGTDAGGQCGRAIFSDVHVDSAPAGGAFPAYCPSNPNANDHAPNELALEFLFFDLSSCVQNDTQAPPPPPPAK
jgi:hypothetical protein